MTDAVVVGSGPNGLAAAVTLAHAGLAVRVYERLDTVGGAASSAELTLPGFLHDRGSAVHPMALESEFFRRFELADRVEFRLPPASFGQTLPDGRAAVAYRDLRRTADRLGRDGAAYARLIGPLAERAERVARLANRPLLRVPDDPRMLVRFGLGVLAQGTPLWNAGFSDDAAPALLTGAAAHAIRPLPGFAPAAAGLALTAYAHARGWPIPVGGSQAIAEALAADLAAHGGEVVTGADIRSLDELPPVRAVLLDVSAAGVDLLAGHRMPSAYLARLRRFRYGAGVAKVDFALSDPVPWAAEALKGAGTVHVGGTRAEMVAAERAIARGLVSEHPYVLAGQPSVVDETRAPAGRSTLWTYAHVPARSNTDMTEAVIRRIEEHAPGFRDTILATASQSANELARWDVNLVGGDIGSGAADLAQLLARPVPGPDPWRTPIPGVYLASASATPGPGVHGMAGYQAARSALRREFGFRQPPVLGVGS